MFQKSGGGQAPIMSLLTPEKKEEDQSLDLSLRPGSFNEYIGQGKIKGNLKILIEAAKKRKEKAIEHILLSGGAGLGKTTLAHIIANEIGTGFKITSGPAIERIGDLASILTNLSDGDVLFIDELHRLNKIIEECFYPAMEDYALDIIIGKGPSARTLRLDLPKFTLIGATTRPALISSPLRSRFGATYHLDFYLLEDMEKIILRSSKILKVDIDWPAVKTIARSSRLTPRVANRLLKRVRDYSQVKSDGKISEKIAEEALTMLEIDECGLEPFDRKLLKIIIEKFKGGPVGLQTLAAATGEEIDSIEEVYEPYLLQLGFVARTPRGRLATQLAYQYLGVKYIKNEQNQLL